MATRLSLRDEIANAITDGFAGKVTSRRAYADRIELTVAGYTEPLVVVGPARAASPAVKNHDVILPKTMPRQIAAGISLDVAAILANRNDR